MSKKAFDAKKQKKDLMDKLEQMKKKKEETIVAVLESARKNPKFIKLLKYSMNSIEVFISPPNREIHQNAKIIIKKEGVQIMKLISRANLTNEDIVTQAGEIIWKLISIFDYIDPELAIMFVEQGGHELVMEVLLSKDKGPGSVPFIKILNGLVKVPQLIPKLLNSGLAETVKLVNDLYPDDYEIICLNFETMKRVSYTKSGREYLIKKSLIPSILNSIKKAAEFPTPEPLINGLTILDNLLREPESRGIMRDENAIETLGDILDLFEDNDTVNRMIGKIFGKITEEDDLTKQLKKIKECKDKIEDGSFTGKDGDDLSEALKQTKNLAIVDDLNAICNKPENFDMFKDLFNKMDKLDLNDKDEDFLKNFIKSCKHYLGLMRKLFAPNPEVYNKDTEKGKECKDLIDEIQNSIVKLWDVAKPKMDELEKADPNNMLEPLKDAFKEYFTSYQKSMKDNLDHKPENEPLDGSNLLKKLEYTLDQVVANGKQAFDVNERANLAASEMLKVGDDLLTDKPEISMILPTSIENSYPYMKNVIKCSENEKTLTNDLNVLKNLTDKKENLKEDLIPAIVDFMITKPKFREPNHVNLGILDNYLTDDFINEMHNNPDLKAKPNLGLNYVGAVVSVCSKAYFQTSTVLKVVGNDKNDSSLGFEVKPELEEKINKLGAEILDRLIKAEEYENYIKQLKSKCGSFKPESAKTDQILDLEENLLFHHCMLNVKPFSDMALLEDLKSLQELIRKEVNFIEGFKRNKANENNPKYKEITDASQKRLKIELGLLNKIDDNCVRDYNANQDPKAMGDEKEVLGTDFEVLEKSTDCPNLLGVVNQLRKKLPFLKDNEDQLKFGKDNAPCLDKLIATMINTFRKLIDDEPLDDSIIKAFISIVTKYPDKCNLLVKSGCPRLLLQVMENAQNPNVAQSALELLKLITLSNEENLLMVANQNILGKLFEIRKKYSKDEKITKGVEQIANELMKLPGQEDKSIEIVNDAIKEFHENVQKDLKNPDVKESILDNLETINSFSTNKKIVQNSLVNDEFLGDMTTDVEATCKDDDISKVNENSLINQSDILKKIRDQILLNENNKDDEATVKKNLAIVDNLLNMIKNKNGYKDILLDSLKGLTGYIENETTFDKLLKDKIDTDFIDKLLEIRDNYLDNPEICKEINNALCYLALRNPKLADYIVQKGGLANVIEELKFCADANDDASKHLKLNGLKMLDTLLNDDKNLDEFVNAKGVDLINRIVKNECAITQKAAETSPFKTIDTINTKTKEMMQKEEIEGIRPLSNDTGATGNLPVGTGGNLGDKNGLKGDDSYFVHCVKIIQKGINKGKSGFVDDKLIGNLTKLAEANYPNKDLFNEVVGILTNPAVELQKDNLKNNEGLMKVAYSNEAKFFPDNDVKDKIKTIEDKIGGDTIKNPDYAKDVKGEINQNLDKPDLKELNKLVTYVAFSTNNDGYDKVLDEDKDDILKLYNHMIKAYKLENKDLLGNNLDNVLNGDNNDNLNNANLNNGNLNNDNLNNYDANNANANDNLLNKNGEEGKEGEPKTGENAELLGQKDNEDKIKLKSSKKRDPNCDEGVVISLMMLANYLVDKGLIPTTSDEPIQNLINIAEPFNTPDNYIFVDEYNDQMRKLLDKFGRLQKDGGDDNNNSGANLSGKLNNKDNTGDNANAEEGKDNTGDNANAEDGKDKSGDNLNDKTNASLDSTSKKTGEDEEPLNYTTANLNYLSSSFTNQFPFLEDYHKELKSAPIGSYPDMNNLKEGNLDKVLDNDLDYYKTDEDQGLKEEKGQKVSDDVLDVIDDLEKEGLMKLKEDKKPDLSDVQTKQIVDRINKLWAIQKRALQNDKKGELVEKEKDVKNIMDKLANTINNKGIDEPNLRDIPYEISTKTENNDDINSKLSKFCRDDIMSHKDNEDIVRKDLETLANLSKYPTPMRDIQKDEELWKYITKLYKDTKDIPTRKALSEIFKNATQNNVQVEKLINNDDPIVDTIFDKVLVDPMKDVDDTTHDVKFNELESCCNCLKDENNLDSLLNKNKVNDDQLQTIEGTVKQNSDELYQRIAPVLLHFREKNKSNEEEDLLNKDTDRLRELLAIVEAAFKEHVDELGKLGAVEEGNPTNSYLTESNIVQSASTIRKGRLSLISYTLLFNPNNNKVKSNISTKTNSDMIGTQDGLLSLLRKFYNDSKTSENADLNKKRHDNINDCVGGLKKLSVSPDNHKPLLDNGLVNYMEKIANDPKTTLDHNLGSKDVLKNCSESPTAVATIVESPDLFDKLTDEILNLYDNPEKISESEDMKKLFLCDNITFGNICKNPKGFEAVFSKIGMDKLLDLGNKTGNVFLLESILNMILNYVKHHGNLEELPDKFWNAVLSIVSKCLLLKEKTPSLLSKVFELISYIYFGKLMPKIDNMKVIPKIQESFDNYKDDKEYLNSSVLCLTKMSNGYSNNSKETVDSGLVTKIKDEVDKINVNENQDLVNSISNLYRVLVSNNNENIDAFCKDGITQNILKLLDTFVPTIENEEGGKKQLNDLYSNLIFQEKDDSLSGAPEEEVSLNKQIIRNNINAIDSITISQPANAYLADKTNFNDVVTDSLDEKVKDEEYIKQALHSMGNYLYAPAGNNIKNLDLEKLYQILLRIITDFYSNGEILSNTNYVCGSLMTNLKDNGYIVKFFGLVGETTKAQDWNIPLLLHAFKIMYKALESHPFMIDEVYDDTAPNLFNLLRLHSNNLDVQISIYKIFSLFAKNNIYSYSMVNSGLMENIKESLNNPEFKNSKRASGLIKPIIFKLLNDLSGEDSNAQKIADELMEPLLKELDDEGITNETEFIVSLLSKLTCLKDVVQPYVQFKGLDIIIKQLEDPENSTKVDAILDMFKILLNCANASDEYKVMMQELKVPELINQVIRNSSLYDKKIEFDGRALIYVINSGKVQLESVDDVELSDIKIKNPIKPEVRNFLTSGRTLKVINHRGAVKEMQLTFSQDLLKVFAKKNKSNLPPKPKYVIETVQIKQIIKGHGTDNFKKSKGLFRKIPPPELCFSIIGPTSVDGLKSINVQCDNERDVNKWISYMEIVINYLRKTKAIKTNVVFKK